MESELLCAEDEYGLGIKMADYMRQNHSGPPVRVTKATHVDYEGVDVELGGDDGLMGIRRHMTGGWLGTPFCFEQVIEPSQGRGGK